MQRAKIVVSNKIMILSIVLYLILNVCQIVRAYTPYTVSN